MQKKADILGNFPVEYSLMINAARNNCKDIPFKTNSKQK